ncbi:MAG: transketolase, partial [Methylococcales bacterium]|nr:transketolase [Methylococcales bacterium]
MGKDKLEMICRLIRYDILASTTQAGSGHPTSSLSSVELMANFFFGGGDNGNYFRFDFDNPGKPENDRLIFSKGHAAPLLYSLYHVAGVITGEDLMTLRQFGSKFEGHPVPRLKYVDVATGSLGQGLSIGVGMALALKLKAKNSKSVKRDPKVWVLLGDSEMAEGQVWEAMETASHYSLNNLIAVVDVNRLGQSTETMGKWNLEYYLEKAKAFGWDTYALEDGHNINDIDVVYRKIYQGDRGSRKKPVMIVAKTVKGKGVGILE